MPTFLLLLLAGAAGTAARYGLTLGIQHFWRAQLGPATVLNVFPIGTLVINVVGSFLLAFVTTLALKGAVKPEMRLILGTGFCGAFTTFSTFELEAEAWMRTHAGAASLYIFGNLVLGFAAILAGRALALKLTASGA